MRITLSTLLLIFAALTLCAGERSAEYYHGLVQSLKVDDLGLQERALKRELLSLNLAEPIHDVLAATKTNDFRFRSIAGYSVYAPMSDPWHHLLIAKYGENLISGTSDDRFEIESQILNSLAFQYAKSYNDILLRRILEDEPKMKLVSFSATEPARVTLLNSDKKAILTQHISKDNPGHPLWIFTTENLSLEPHGAASFNQSELDNPIHAAGFSENHMNH